MSARKEILFEKDEMVSILAKAVARYIEDQSVNEEESDSDSMDKKSA